LEVASKDAVWNPPGDGEYLLWLRHQGSSTAAVSNRTAVRHTAW